ncbi:hypothetical protein Tco_1308456, partial [Tanacetum coccineum]
QLSSNLNSKEPTLQVVLDTLKLTYFYKAFVITGDVPEIYMQEFWVTASRHHSSLHFKMNDKSHTVNVDNFRDMLNICHKIPGQKFEDPLFEEEILSFIRELGHTYEIKVLSYVNVNHMHQPWRSFAAIINKCLSGKTTALESLRLSRAQILWGMYHNKNVYYVYLMWDDLVFQVENKNSKKNNDMDDSMFTTIRVIFKHQDTHVYGAILPQHLTNQAMLEFKAYKTYHAYATGEKIPKSKYVKNKADPESSPKKKSAQASKGKRLKTSTKVAKLVKKKQPATTSKEKGLNMLSEGALTEVEQINLATKRSLIQTHSSHASISGADESNDEKDDDEVSMSKDDDDNTEDDQNDDNVDNEETQDKEDKKEEWSDDEAYDEETQGGNDEKEKMDREEINEDEEVNELYRDVNINLEGRDTKMADANQSSSVSSGFISNILNPNPDIGIDSILNLNTESTSLVDVPVTTNAEMPPSSVTTLPLPPISIIQPLQQTLVPTPTIVPSTSLQNLPTFGYLFKFKDREKSLEDNFSEFKQTNPFTEAVSSVPCIVDMYLANKMNEAVKAVVQL